MSLIHWILNFFINIFLTPILILWAIVCRYMPKTIDVGLGPEPLINNVYHKKALIRYGYTAETFVSQIYFITTDFDVRADLWFVWLGKRRNDRIASVLCNLALFFRAINRYRVLYVYLHGGPLGLLGLGLNNTYLIQLEPRLYRLGKVRVVVMPYGGDVQDMSRSHNLLFKHALAKDYPEHRHRRKNIAMRIDLWTNHADHLISGCEWVDYMYHWDSLMLAHFSIDVEQWQPSELVNLPITSDAPLRVLHAPNHRLIKGTQYLLAAIDALQREGVPIELVLLERVPNSEIKRVMATIDIVADQWVIGWYAMFALEAMALAKPVLCFLRADLESFYVNAGLIQLGEIPIVRCDPVSLQETLRQLAQGTRAELQVRGNVSREFVIRHHSTQAVGSIFDKINRELGIMPAGAIGSH